ncbi:MAG: hypothetical protein IJS15_05995 [Victivallales bacterium]|nr:hypothetical protein [Victivallales bacterium]
MTNRRLGADFALFLICALFLVQERIFAQESGSWEGEIPIEAITAGQLSRQREEAAVNLAFDYLSKHGKDSSDESVVDAIISAFMEGNPDVKENPKAALLTVEECAKAAAKSIKRAADEKFPIKTDEQLAEEARKKFPLYKIGDHVTVFYGKNPQVPSEVKGVYYGTVSGYVQVGSNRVRIDDMRRIKDYRDEVLKFDPDATEQLRKEYIKRQQRVNLRDHENFIDENTDAIVQAEIAKFADKNEQNGYTCIDDAWLPLRGFLAASVGKARAKLARFEEEQHQRQIDERLGFVEAQTGTLEMHWTVVPSSSRLNPSAILKEMALREKKKAEAEAKRIADEKARVEAAEAAEKDAEEKRKAAEAAKAEAEAAAAAKSADNAEEDEIRREEEASRKQMTMMIVVACGALLVLVAVVLIIMKIRANREKTRFKRFFEGNGKLQKDFWDMAAADPKNFKYVAYMFPNLKDASKALTRLTYIQALPNGELKSTRDIMFGVYPHQDGAVAFLGGTKFHYALWREASAVLPELEGASYFKVSEEPEVKLDIPDIKTIGADGEIESLGVEDATDAEGSFTRCYKYRIHSRETAMAFLENFQINEEGIVVQVETDEGVLGKDENGIFTA